MTEVPTTPSENSRFTLRRPSSVQMLRLLMWKNYLLQTRHKTQTISEILLPLMTLTNILILRYQIPPFLSSTNRYDWVNLTGPKDTILKGFDLSNLAVAYSPKNILLRDIVEAASKKLIEGIGGQYTLKNIEEYDNLTHLSELYQSEKSIYQVLAAVEFPDNLHDINELPDDMEYSLRFPELPRCYSFYGEGSLSWHTMDIFQNFQPPGPRLPYSYTGGNEPDYYNEYFLTFQYFLSTEIIAKITGQNSVREFKLNCRRLPSQPFLEDYSQDSMKILMPMVMVLSYSYSAVSLVRTLAVEKENNIKEYMEIMGMNSKLYWSAWFCKQIMFLTISAILVVVILKVKWFKNSHGMKYSVLTFTPWSVLLLYLMLYMVCLICFCFMLSSLFASAVTASLFTGIISFLIYIPSIAFSVNISTPICLQILSSLLLNTLFSQGLQVLINKEGVGGMQWGHFLYNPEQRLKRLLFGHIIFLMVTTSVMYLLVAMYLERVNPGLYGTTKKWYYPISSRNFFHKIFKQKSDKFRDSFGFDESEVQKEANITIREADPVGRHLIGVKIERLTKAFGNQNAVRNLTLNVYHDQITVLLGHNGAGKSTTMAMLTGALPPTNGSIIVEGYDMSTQRDKAREQLGYCPQHNVLFKELTVKEHLLLYSRLKGLSDSEIGKEIKTLIAKLELQVKTNSKAKTLSGGQKRRLQVGIALCGGARVVLLDEPTSGMDPASRRALWDLLQEEKKGRTIIFTTHFLDEADILGDRIAIMAGGRLICDGTPFFLKKYYGSEYVLTIVKSEGFQQQVCTDIISKHIPDCYVYDDRGTEIKYKFGTDYSKIFEKLLSDIEANIDNIKYLSYGLSATTLEDIFMNIGSDVPSPRAQNLTFQIKKNESKTMSLKDVNEEKNTVKGKRLLLQHIYSILLKLWLIWIRSWPTILLQIAVPILILVLALGLVKFVISMVPVIVKRELTLAKGYGSTETLLHYNGSSNTSLGARGSEAYLKLFQSAKSPSMRLTYVKTSLPDYYLSRTRDPKIAASLWHSILMGASFEDNSATFWFTAFSYHDIAISLATLQNALLKAQKSDANLKVYNHPLNVIYKRQSNTNLAKQVLTIFVTFGVGITLSIVSSVFIMFYIKENTCQAKLLQKAAGIRPITMWFTTFAFDFIWFIINCVPIIINLIIFKIYGLSQIPSEVENVILCVNVYAFAMLPLTYLLSCFFHLPTIGFGVMFFMNLFCGVMAPLIIGVLQDNDKIEIANFLDGFFQFYPLYALVNSFRTLNKVGLKKWLCIKMCNNLIKVSPNITVCNMEVMCNIQPSDCCGGDDVFQWEEPGIVRYLCTMCFTGSMVWIIFMGFEYKCFHRYFNKTKRPPPLVKDSLDADVLSEMEYVENVVRSRGESDNDNVLVADGLTKYYKDFLAVNQISFTVSKGDCFGLLGENGAGKTTTFKMLMGDERISYGDAYICQHSVRKHMTDAYRHIGYCPQFDALFNELTARETLKFFCILRGLRQATTVNSIDMLAQLLGFTKYLDKKVKNYSGGNRRKLSTAISLLGDSSLVFVDEPTTGVDAAAKRLVWSAIQEAQRAGRGVVLTSHSMEEHEALCTRLTIMVNGQFMCIGSPQHLKNKFSQGYTLTIKMKMDQVKSADHQNMLHLQRFISSWFKNSRVVEECNGLVKFYLTYLEHSWPKLFGLMEDNKAALKIEDYTISQTTLEQIFLQFTKYQNDANQAEQ